MDTSIRQLASTFGGTVDGDDAARIRGIETLEGAGATDLAPLLHVRYLTAAQESKAGVLLTTKALAAKLRERSCWIHTSPRLALAKVLQQLSPPPESIESGIHDSAVVAPKASVDPAARIEALAVIESGCTIGARTVVGARAVIVGGSQIGTDCQLGPGSMVLAGSVVGDRVRLGPGAVIGSEGFGFLPAGSSDDGEILKPLRIPQIGHVVIEDDVDIGALAVVDRATIGKTIVKRGAKLDNLVHVGHNALVGEGVIIAAQSGLAGSVSIGAGALLGGQVGIADHLDIGREAKVAAKSGVVSDIPRNATYAGYPAVPHSQWLRAWGTLLRRWTTRTRRHS